MITSLIYDRAYHFVNGFGMGVKDKKWWFVRPDGSTVGSRGYAAVIPFEEGYAGVRVDDESGRRWGLIDESGNEVLPIAYGLLIYAGNGMWWVGKTYYEWALYQPGSPAPTTYPYADWNRFDGPYLIVPVEVDDVTRYRVITADGEVVFESTQRVFAFSEEIALVRDSDGRHYLRQDGSPVIDQAFYSARPFENGVAQASVGSSWSDQQWGILSKDGSWLMPPRYSWMGTFNADGLARYRIGDRFGFANRAGEEVTPARWDNTGEFADGLCPVLRDGLWGYVDSRGEVVVPLQYDYAWDFNNGYGVVRYGDRESGQRLYIDASGEPLAPDRFDWAYNFDGDLAHIATGDFETGRFGYVNEEGDIVWEPSH